ncbi:hypothetical protein GARC_1958 [Paraglaciecola arctica BSs20135]|uniref:Uncharacterized protein n=2 Tax=Paraglaciecola TaxID=1621534 RepID=K6Z669_9ALTE|nr:hypothetical protein GARC_1958 [Paraglaciecola arctica BSs20135]
MSSPALAQQSGSIKGKVSTEIAGVTIAGVTVTASSNVMPKPRTVTTKADGSYNLSALLPGKYTLTFTSADGTVRQTDVEVLLNQSSSINVAFEAPPISDVEVIYITSSKVIRDGDSSLTNSLSQETVSKIPSGQSYRDLLAIIPGVQYSENGVLGPSAGGSGRDNKYGFDGVDISLPMFGNLSSEPSTHDVAYVTIDRGGAKAIGFNRSGGLSINTTSKSGTNDFHANVEYRTQPKSLYADKDGTDNTKYDTNKTWITTSISGPLIEDELFFYGSYFRPETKRTNKETAYGSVKDNDSKRDEFFGKLTWAPTDDLLFNLSARNSDKEKVGDSVGALDQDSTSEGSYSKIGIYAFEGTYLVNDDTELSFQYSKYEDKGSTRADTLLPDVIPRIGDSLDLTKLDQLGLFRVPTIQDDDAVALGYDNDAAQVLIDNYGFLNDDNVRAGGGSIGADNTIDSVEYYRDSFEIKLDHDTEIAGMEHSIHAGFQWKENKEVLARFSNGWGSISFIGGSPTDDFDGETPVYYSASVEQMSLRDSSGEAVPAITSISENYNFEINDTITHGDFTYNVGVLISKDILYGQGLKENSNNVSGYELAPGHKYKMYEVDFADMIQPRLGIIWAYNDEDTVFANYSSYNPDVSSLARAASWARNTRRSKNVYFDENGAYLGDTDAAGSSGKFFQPNMKPRRTDEITIGATKAISNELLLRTHVRQRTAKHAWEDTPNNARLAGDYTSPFGGVPAHIADKGLYIENLQAYRDEVGGSSYVVADLDGAENKYYEFSVEGEYAGDNSYLNVSYVWSHYYGNYDQDITSASSDANLFVGSSNLGDGNGRQLWDGKYGKLNGDRPHILKAMGYYTTDWNADIGFNFVYQSGDVWEAWDGTAYGFGSSTIRYSEPAGSRREPSHWQLDANYTQNFDITDDLVMKFTAEVYNIFDKQTGYNYDPYVSNDTFGEAKNSITPRRVQLTVNIGF